MAIDPVLDRLPSEPEVLIELPRFGVVKRRSDGSIDFISPVPCPYNYGCIPGLVAGDGDPLDALVLGPRLARGTLVRTRARAVVDFVDLDRADPKVVCSAAPLSVWERAGIARFFASYAVAKRALALLRGKRGTIAFRGLVPVEPPQA